jgi:hypothetical protein
MALPAAPPSRKATVPADHGLTRVGEGSLTTPSAIVPSGLPGPIKRVPISVAIA